MNRILKTAAAFTLILILIGASYLLYLIYSRYPKLRSDIRRDTASAIGSWFPVSEEGEFSYDIEISFSPKECFIKNLHVKGGSGRALDGLKLEEYELTAELMELNLDSLLHGQPLKIERMEQARLVGKISSDAILEYMNPQRTGMTISETGYDDFTEKVFFLANIEEFKGLEVQIEGRWAVTDDGALTVEERYYRNPDSPVASKVIEFIEENTDPTIRFAIFDIPLKVTDFRFDGEYLEVALMRD